MATFYFLRHGETDENKAHHIQGQRDIPLNDTGIAQAHLVGNYLKRNNIMFDMIFTSPLIRASKTAEIVKEEIGFNGDVVSNQAFIERCFGVKEGCDVCPEVFIEINNDTAIGLEKSYLIQKRVKDEVLRLSNIYPDANFLVVAHSHTIKALTTACDSNKYRFDDKMSNCALTVFSCIKNNIKVIDYNIETQN